MNTDFSELSMLSGYDHATTIDTSEGKPVFLIKARSGAHVRLSQSAYFLLRAIRSGISFEELSTIINRSQLNRKVSAEELREKHGKVLKEIAQIERRFVSGLPGGFWLRLRILPESIVVRVSSLLSHLYNPHMLVALIVLLVAAVGDALHYGLTLRIAGGALLPGYGLFLLSLLFHELGHASACARYGARPSDIGFTVYLIYPAFYSDVSAAWQLSRWQRVVVDVGGCFFQMVLGAVFVIAFRLTGWEPLRIAVFAIIYSCIVSLNPVFKFDGYWMFGDALGVTNLSKQPSRIGRYLTNRLLGRATRPLPWSLRITAVLIIYSLASTYVWGRFLWMLAPAFWTRTLIFSHQIGVFRNHLLANEMPRWRDFTGLLASMALLSVAVLALYQLVQRFFLPILKIIFKRTFSFYSYRNASKGSTFVTRHEGT